MNLMFQIIDLAPLILDQLALLGELLIVIGQLALVLGEGHMNQLQVGIQLRLVLLDLLLGRTPLHEEAQNHQLLSRDSELCLNLLPVLGVLSVDLTLEPAFDLLQLCLIVPAERLVDKDIHTLIHRISTEGADQPTPDLGETRSLDLDQRTLGGARESGGERCHEQAGQNAGPGSHE